MVLAMTQRTDYQILTLGCESCVVKDVQDLTEERCRKLRKKLERSNCEAVMLGVN